MCTNVMGYQYFVYRKCCSFIQKPIWFGRSSFTLTHYLVLSRFFYPLLRADDECIVCVLWMIIFRKIAVVNTIDVRTAYKYNWKMLHIDFNIEPATVFVK